MPIVFRRKNAAEADRDKGQVMRLLVDASFSSPRTIASYGSERLTALSGVKLTSLMEVKVEHSVRLSSTTFLRPALVPAKGKVSIALSHSPRRSEMAAGDESSSAMEEAGVSSDPLALCASLEVASDSHPIEVGREEVEEVFGERGARKASSSGEGHGKKRTLSVDMLGWLRGRSKAGLELSMRMGESIVVGGYRMKALLVFKGSRPRLGKQC